MKYWLSLAVLCLASCSRSQPPLPVYGQVPEFQLTSQSGQPFDSKSLVGKIWVADFFYTHCTGPCPMMSAKMHLIQREVARLSDVRLVSITVDPARDTPPVLAGYAKEFRAEPDRWYFLTGTDDQLNHLSFNVFKLSKIDSSLNHSTRFVLMDRQSRIRGYYLSSDESTIPDVLRDIRRLEDEKS